MRMQVARARATRGSEVIKDMQTHCAGRIVLVLAVVGRGRYLKPPSSVAHGLAVIISVITGRG